MSRWMSEGVQFMQVTVCKQEEGRERLASQGWKGESLTASMFDFH